MTDILRVDGSRKRQKISRDESGPALKRHLPMDSAAAGEGSSAMARRRNQPEARQTQTSPHSHDRACPHEAALNTLHSDVNAMRDLVTCQVCHRLMYEPFQLSCGHTYCYTCLSQWLGSNHKKTCPDCRAVIRQQPTPSYVIRELVLIFVSRNQLLPDGETAEEHHTLAQEEAAVVAKDKANKDTKTGGLFKGTFSRGVLGNLMPMRDPIDGVDRCPTCHWEVEDGYCNQCGLPVGEGFSDFDDDESDNETSDEELDGDIMPHDDVDGFGADGGADVFGQEDDDNMDIDPAVLNAAFGGPPAHRVDGWNRWIRGREQPPIFTDMESPEHTETEDDDDDDEGSSEMDDFIDDDEGQTHVPYDDTSDDTEVQILATRPGRRRTASAVVVSGGDRSRPAPNRAISIDESSSEGSSDDEDDTPVTVTSRRNKPVQNGFANRRRPVMVDSEDDSTSDEESDDAHQHVTETSTVRAFSPLVPAVADDHDDETDNASTRYGSEAPTPVMGTYNNVDVETSDTESSDGEEEDRWEADQVFRPLPPSLHDLRNRLQTRQQHRPRTLRLLDSANRRQPIFGGALHGALGGQYAAATETLCEVPARHNATVPSAGRSRPAAMSGPPPADMTPSRLNAHPFSLTNTLRDINHRGRAVGFNTRRDTLHQRPHLHPVEGFATLLREAAERHERRKRDAAARHAVRTNQGNRVPPAGVTTGAGDEVIGRARETAAELGAAERAIDWCLRDRQQRMSRRQ